MDNKSIIVISSTPEVLNVLLIEHIEPLQGYFHSFLSYYTYSTLSGFYIKFKQAQETVLNFLNRITYSNLIVTQSRTQRGHACCRP